MIRVKEKQMKEHNADAQIRMYNERTIFMEFTTLSNGIKAPLLGVGTFLLSLEETEKSVYEAIRLGYRMIDTANGYLNETAVGKAVARAISEGLVKREDLFISTKLWPTVYEQDTSVEDTLKRLGLDYVDLLFIHQPAGNFIAGYQQLEKAYKEGKAKALGISNFHDGKLKKLLAAADVKPHVIQLETHPYYAHHAQMDRLKEYGTKLMGWYPLGHGDAGLLHEKVFEDLAVKYHKSTIQIILRWAVQYGVMTIPGSKNPEHLRSNFDIFDFSLTDEEMQEIAKLDGTKRYYHADNAMEERYASMHLCIEK